MFRGVVKSSTFLALRLKVVDGGPGLRRDDGRHEGGWDAGWWRTLSHKNFLVLFF
jgi:hypothetical protein